MQIETIAPSAGEPQPKHRIWGGWATVGLSAAIFGVFFTAQNLAAVIFLAVQISQNPALWSLSSLIDYLSQLQNNGLMLSIAIIFSAICGFFFIWLFIRLRGGYSFRDYLEFNRLERSQWLMILGGFILVILFGSLLDRVSSDTSSLKMMTEAYLSSGWTPIFWIAAVIFAPIFEESFFRGFLFVGLRDSRAGPVWAVIISSVTFAIGHLQYNWQGITSILFIGLVFGVVRFFSKSLWTTIMLHSAWNLFSLISLVIYLNNPV